MTNLRLYITACHSSHGRIEFCRVQLCRPDGAFDPGRTEVWFRDELEYACRLRSDIFTLYKADHGWDIGARVHLIHTSTKRVYLTTNPNHELRDNLDNLPDDFTLAERALASHRRPMFDDGSWRSIHLRGA